ncbi:putative inner membrane protein [Helicobacter mustelae]|uniref:FUSC family protein n=1 Tax=Helicobacter mustelae TaxID=217 RepID=UPI000E014CA8|nr:FUSC family protein [Helicobacter mustelae]STP12582.1 putative inner membrane protein [Helicobacter mustelae]
MIFRRFFASVFGLKERFRHFIGLYDPGYISFIYAQKALFASILSALLAVLIFGVNLGIWGALIPIHLYFLNVILVEQKQTIWYFVLFLILAALFCYLFYLVFLFPNPFLFAILLMGIGFIAGILGSYQMDLQRVVNMSLVDGLIAYVYMKSGIPIGIKEQIIVLFLGGGIGIFTHFFMSFKKYGKISRKYFPDLLIKLEFMVEHLNKPKDFIHLRYQVFQQIEFIKRILNSKAISMKDPHTIKDTKRALFSLYRIEEIYQCINAIHEDACITSKNFLPIRREIIFNIRELRKIFDGHIAHLRENAMQKMRPEDFGHSLLNIIKIIYSKCHSLRRGGQEEDYFLEARNKKKPKAIWQSIKNRDPYFYFSIKYSLVLGISVFVSDLFDMSHGAWIAMACVAVMRPNLGGVKNIGKEYLIGVLMGLVIGVLIIMLTQGSVLFYFFFMLVIFGFIYFRAFPYRLWASFMMMSFIMMFSLVYSFSYALILDRFMDIFLAFGIVFCVFLFFWPRYSASEILPNIKASFSFFQDFYETIIKNFENLGYLQNPIRSYQQRFLDIYNLLETHLREAKKEKKSLQDVRFSYQGLKYLDLLCQNTFKIYYMLLEMPRDKILEQKELYINDLKLLKVRYEMMNRSLENHSFYFKQHQDDRFLSQDVVFSEVVKMIFETQNKIFQSMQEKGE